MSKEDLTNKLLEKSIAYLENSEAFLTNEIPIYVEQLLKYEVVEIYTKSLVCIPFFLLGIFIMVWGYKSYKKAKKDGDRYIDDEITTIVAGTFVFLLTLILCSSYVLKIIKINIAPKVYLLEYLKDM